MAYGYITEKQNLARSLAAAAFTSSSGPADATRSRLNDKWMDRLYSMNVAASGVSLSVDLGSAQQVNTIGLLNHTLALIGAGPRTITVQAADDSIFSTGLVTPATITLSATTSRPRDTVVAFGAVTKRYWRFVFAWAGGGSAGIAVGEVVMGVATTLTRGELDGSGESDRIYAPQVKLANGGVTAITLTGPVLERRLKFVDFNPTEMAFLRTLRRAVAGSVPLLWCDDWVQTSAPSESQQKGLWGHVVEADYDETYTNWRLSTPNDLVLLSQGRETGA